LPPPEPSAAPRTLPLELTSFVGRRDELAAIKRLLGTSRLVTLTGPGGVGKTRLALRSARDVARHYADGACFVRLADVEDPLLVTPAVFGALGLQDRSAGWSLGMLAEHLAERRLLLVLDNCEHVIDAAAVLTGTLLRACPDLRIIATSRQALGVAGEVVEHVPPLWLPEPENPSTTDAVRSDAVSLFVERAAAARPGFTLDAANAPSVVELCRRLDGVPLALELAAVRLDALGLDVLLQGLRDRLDVLGMGDRSHEPRQRTLEATIDWSYQLLSAAERLLWARLSIFAGGFELDAAQQVCADDELPARSIPSLLASLVEKSLVKQGRLGGRERFLVLEILREFARERLRDSGTERATRRGHAEWVAVLASDVAAQDERLVELFGRVRAEQANIWLALDFSVEDDEGIERGIAICRDLVPFWHADGHFSQVIGTLLSLLDRVPARARPRGEALWVTALIYATGADAQHGRRYANEALDIGRSIGAADVVAWALVGLASASWVEGRWDDAIATATEAADLSRLMGLGFPRLTALNVIALARRFEADIDGAIAVGHEALTVSEELGETWLRAYTLHFLAAATLLNGDPDEAERLARRGVEIRRDLGHAYGLGSLAEVLASVAIAKGDDQRAATLLGGADALWRSISWTHTAANLAQHDSVRAATRSRLGAGRYDRAFDAGLGMTTAEVAEYALGGAMPVKAPSATAASEPRPILSPREMEVARLVAGGATNAQTATQLFVGERTVESHVASIFNKLGVDSRVQIARWVATVEGPAKP
jgi:predicted ATPase/DNA-binding CsgD family transcriptional regulator